MGPLIIGVGILVVIVGALVLSGGLSWFGRLPGDIRTQGENTRVYIPVVSCLVISLALSVIVSLIRRFL